MYKVSNEFFGGFLIKNLNKTEIIPKQTFYCCKSINLFINSLS